MRHSRNDLASTDNLAGLGQSLDHYAVRISKQNGIAQLIASNVSMGLRRIRHTVELKDTPETRGLIHKVRHLVTVE